MPIDWNFDRTVPVCDFLEGLDLDDPAVVLKAAEEFIDQMDMDLFRCWETIIRDEQDLPTTDSLQELTREQVEYDGSPVLYIQEAPRLKQPWYQIVRALAPRLLSEPFATAGNPGLADVWPRMAQAIEEHSHGLSLPEGVNEPLDVLPLTLRHKLWLQACFDWLSGLGQADDLTLARHDQRDRIDHFIEELRGHRDSVRFLELTLDSLLGGLVIPERDRRILVEQMCGRLNLAATSELLAPRLEPPQVSPQPVERLSEESIKQAILHPDLLVREMAVTYFSHSHSLDPTVALLAIEAIERYGWDDAFMRHDFFDTLAHSDESVTWMIEQLLSDRSAKQETIVGPDLLYALAVADAAVLCRHARQLARTRRLNRGVHQLIQDRVELQRLSSKQLWWEFEQAINDTGEGCPELLETKPILDVAERLSDDERVRNWVLGTLERRLDEPGYNAWREIVAVQMAGVLRLSAAVPRLAALLKPDEADLNHAAIESLIAIGGDLVVDTLDRRFAAAGGNFRTHASYVLANIHTEQSASALFRWLHVERDEGLSSRILSSLLNGFIPAAIEPARQQLSAAQRVGWYQRYLRIDLVTLCSLTGCQFPELEHWRREAETDFATQPWPDDDEDGENEDEEDPWEGPPGRIARDIADDLGPGVADSPLPGWLPAQPIRQTGPRAGRNDPCPCGSGKKYKKCCLRRQE